LLVKLASSDWAAASIGMPVLPAMVKEAISATTMPLGLPTARAYPSPPQFREKIKMGLIFDLIAPCSSRSSCRSSSVG
jgi:hypothetical protein